MKIKALILAAALMPTMAMATLTDEDCTELSEIAGRVMEYRQNGESFRSVMIAEAGGQSDERVAKATRVIITVAYQVEIRGSEQGKMSAIESYRSLNEQLCYQTMIGLK